MSVRKRVAEKIVNARNEKGLSQEKLANLANIDRSNFAKIEQGEKNFMIGTLDKIANALDVDISELF